MKCAYCQGVMAETQRVFARADGKQVKVGTRTVRYFNAPFCRPKCAISFAKALYAEGYRISATSNQVTRIGD